MIHAFFVTIGVLAAIMFIRCLPLIVVFILVTLTSKFFWYCVLWLVALLAAIIGLTPLGLIAMIISVPVLLVRFKLRERVEIREIAPQRLLKSNLPKPNSAFCPDDRIDWSGLGSRKVSCTPRPQYFDFGPLN